MKSVYFYLRDLLQWIKFNLVGNRNLSKEKTFNLLLCLVIYFIKINIVTYFAIVY